MKKRQLMNKGRKLCAIILIFAFGLYSPAYSSVGVVSSKEKKKSYLVTTTTASQIQKLKKNYEESAMTNNNSEGLLEDNKMLAVNLTESEREELGEDGSVVTMEEDAVVKGSAKKTIRILNKKIHTKKVKKLKKNESENEWNLRMIHADSAELTKKEKEQAKKKKVKIAVLDSGVDYGNDIELASNISLVPGEEEMSPLFMDGSGHGNSVAGLIAAKKDEEGITGVNPDVEIHSIRVLDDNNEAPLSRVIEGIYRAIDLNVNVINMSFGLNEYSAALEQAIQDASDVGILLVAAAGNTGDSGVQYPAAYDEVVAVGSVDKNGEVAETSAKGEEVEVVAPGELVRSTGILPSVQLVESGTSLAAPQVSGTASLIWAKDMTASADFVRYAISQSANAYGDSEAYGNGLLDAEYALEHYEEIKAAYESDKAETKEFVNQKEVLSFEQTGCVAGSWSKYEHEVMVLEAGTYNNVKKGARFPDIKEPYGDDDTEIYTFARISQNPWWHGSYLKGTNYVATYIYETRVANNMLTQNYATVTAVAPGGLSSDQKKKINDDLHDIDWAREYKGKMPSAGTRRAFVWGMAIHNLADAFAHSVYVYSTKDKQYHHLAHEDGKGYDYADNPDRYKPRYKNAVDAVRRSISRYINRENNEYKSGTSAEFDAVKFNGNVYLMRELTQNATAVTGVYMKEYEPYTYTENSTEAYAILLQTMGLASQIPGSARPYK